MRILHTTALGAFVRPRARASDRPQSALRPGQIRPGPPRKIALSPACEPRRVQSSSQRKKLDNTADFILSHYFATCSTIQFVTPSHRAVPPMHH
jgi:hypothetical protein